jgi:hypothetical protein
MITISGAKAILFREDASADLARNPDFPDGFLYRRQDSIDEFHGLISLISSEHQPGDWI